MSMKQNASGLWVDEGTQEPEREWGGWPPKIIIPDDAKTSHMHAHQEGMGMRSASRHRGLPHWGDRGIETQS